MIIYILIIVYNNIYLYTLKELGPDGDIVVTIDKIINLRIQFLNGFNDSEPSGKIVSIK